MARAKDDGSRHEGAASAKSRRLEQASELGQLNIATAAITLLMARQMGAKADKEYGLVCGEMDRDWGYRGFE